MFFKSFFLFLICKHMKYVRVYTCFLWQIYCALILRSCIILEPLVLLAKFRFCFYPFQAQLQREKEQDHMKLQAKLEKLDVLEKECFKLTTTQKTAEVSCHLFLWSDDARNKSLVLSIIRPICEYTVNLIYKTSLTALRNPDMIFWLWR